MGNYLTTYKVQLVKHVRSVYNFQDTRALSAAERKTLVNKLLDQAIPIPPETYDWLGTMFRYVRDKTNGWYITTLQVYGTMRWMTHL